MLLLANKLIKKIPGPGSIIYMKKKTTKSVKQSETITYQLITFENPNIVDINQLLQNAQKL